MYSIVIVWVHSAAIYTTHLKSDCALMRGDNNNHDKTRNFQKQKKLPGTTAGKNNKRKKKKKRKKQITRMTKKEKKKC